MFISGFFIVHFTVPSFTVSSASVKFNLIFLCADLGAFLFLDLCIPQCLGFNTGLLPPGQNFRADASILGSCIILGLCLQHN